MSQDTRSVHLTAASKQLFSYQCARSDWNMCVISLSATFLLPRGWVRPQQAATFLLPQQKSCQCARCRIKQCSRSGQLNIWAIKVAIACLALMSVCTSVCVPMSFPSRLSGNKFYIYTVGVRCVNYLCILSDITLHTSVRAQRSS